MFIVVLGTNMEEQQEVQQQNQNRVGQIEGQQNVQSSKERRMDGWIDEQFNRQIHKYLNRWIDE